MEVIYKPRILAISKNPSLFCQLLRRISALKRATADFDEDVSKRIEDGHIKPRKHPGILPHKPYSLPRSVKTAITKLINDGPKKQLMTESKEFQKFLFSRGLPKESDTVTNMKPAIEEEVKAALGVNEEVLNEEERKRYIELKNANVNKILKQRIYNWNRLNFSRYLSLLYLVTRSAAEYGVISKIFSEINIRSEISPKSIFDFGSGLGTVIWSAHELWGQSLTEYYCVDSSADVLDIAKYIINEYKDDQFSQRVFQRQFLPSSNEIFSDIVVSAYSLKELPSSAARLETVKNLWERTGKFLILIEMGTKSGFTVLNEARDFILDNYAHKKPGCHIFAPCPHELPCPRASHETKCFFESSYFTFPQVPEELKKEYYSYIVLEKGARDEDSKNWPRIVQPVLCRSKHVICRFCTEAGTLQEVIFTAGKHGKVPYRCAKSSTWGDLFPCRLTPKETELPEEGSSQPPESSR